MNGVEPETLGDNGYEDEFSSEDRGKSADWSDRSPAARDQIISQIPSNNKGLFYSEDRLMKAKHQCTHYIQKVVTVYINPQKRKSNSWTALTMQLERKTKF